MRPESLHFHHPVTDYGIPMSGVHFVIPFIKRTGVHISKSPSMDLVMPWSIWGGTRTGLPLRIPVSKQ